MNRILIALDVPTPADALALADTLRGAVGGFKIGSQLFTAAGPDIVRTLVARGDRVFLDLKFHDIPNTVAGAVTAATELGVWMLNVHASGGAADARGRPRRREPDRRAARTPAAARHRGHRADEPGCRRDRRRSACRPSPLDQVLRLARLAQDAGLDGVVASPQETAAIRQACGPDFVIVTPGIRGGAAASGADDQQPDDGRRRRPCGRQLVSRCGTADYGRP